MPLPLVFYMHAPATGKHWLERLARRTQPDLVLCNSNFTAATSPQLFPGVRAETIYCPVAPSAPGDRNMIRKEKRAELQTSPEAVVIVQVSRMESWKGQVTHLEALSRLTDLPNWVCWQVGGAQQSSERKYLEDLKTMVVHLGIANRVRFLGQRSDVNRLLTSADIFCQPNLSPEPFGIVFVEALNAGLPVVTTDMGGAPEIVDESCGVLVPQGDANSCALALRRLIQEPALRVKLGTAGPSRAGMLCDHVTQLGQFQEALSTVIKERR
jgi:glycosyltransferase involved in cell wall biosynthesis